VALPDPGPDPRGWGYPELDEQAKRNILGLNSAKLYGLQVGTVGADQEGQNEGENEDGRYGRIPANFAKPHHRRPEEAVGAATV